MNIPNDPKWISKRKTWKSETEARLDCWGGEKKKKTEKKETANISIPALG